MTQYSVRHLVDERAVDDAALLVLYVLKHVWDHRLTTPSIRELVRVMRGQISHGTVYNRLRVLRANGLVRMQAGASRTLQISEKGRLYLSEVEDARGLSSLVQSLDLSQLPSISEG